MILVCYDVSTIDSEGRRRLRRVAKACLNRGQRVQNSIFECDLDQAQWVALKNKLLELANLEVDSLRFYYLGNQWKNRVEHVGAKPSIDLRNDPLVL